MFEKLNLFKRMREAEEKTEQLESRVALYEAQVSSLVVEHQEVLDELEKGFSFIDRIADAVLRKVEVDEAVARLCDSSLRTVIDMGGVDLSLKPGLTLLEPMEEP